MSKKDLALEAALLERGFTEENADFIASQSEPAHFIAFLRRKFLGTPLPRRPALPKAAIPDALRWEIWERDDFRCQHCGSRRFLSIDHVFPESLGGDLSPENLRTLCRACNSRKGARLEE